MNHVVFSPDGTRIASVGADGVLRTWNARALKELDQQQVCDATTLHWAASNIIAVQCRDRLNLFDSALRHRGQLFLFQDGLVAIVSGHGVYASPASLQNRVVAFDGSDNLGPAEQISAATTRQALLDEFDLRSFLQDAARRISAWVTETHTSLHPWSYGLWIGLVWVMTLLIASFLWLICPAHLVWLSMPRATGHPLPAQSSTLWSHIVSVILVIRFLGHTRRPLTKWLRANRTILEQECFTERSPVSQRRKFHLFGHEDMLTWFSETIDGKGRGLVWIDGVGGSGKSALGMYMLRETMTGRAGAPVPVFVGEDWTGSLAAQVARQLRHKDWKRGPSETMVRTLGHHGLICPLVDSLSERSRKDSLESVKEAVSTHHFRHLIVTSRKEKPVDQIFEAMRQATPQPMSLEDTKPFIDTYVPEQELARTVETRIAPLLERAGMPSPLFLRFAIDRAEGGELEAMDPWSLIETYVEALRAGRLDIDAWGMKRAAAIASIVAIQERLSSTEFSEAQLRQALTTAGNSEKFANAAGDGELMVANLVEMLVQSGLIVRGMTYSRLQFSYDPVAEYLAAWWALEAPSRTCDALRERIEGNINSAVGKAYLDIFHSERR